MSTRSCIAIEKKDKTIESIYCHFDGYLENNGKMLLEDYKNVNKINHLINLGDISYLAKNVFPYENEIHTFDNPQKDVVVAYNRDRGEEDVDKKIFKSREEFINNGLKEYYSWTEFVYLFVEEENKWYYSTNYDKIYFKELTENEINNKNDDDKIPLF